ncbi:MAG: hypothetical protein HC831_00235 [Chloroflexia bacterium]|nr:hypothetical protein [Bacteroidales bacterium]NJO87545.1 hypothetical protein [Chloroflexia bacterium]
MRYNKYIILKLLCLLSLDGIMAQDNVSQIKIPIGTDAYKNWDLWPMQRPGVRAYMRSTYDRSGGNEAADASHFLFANEETYNVTLDVKGKGCLYFFRTNHWHGSPWHFIADGRDNLVSETGTQEPDLAKKKLKRLILYQSQLFPVHSTGLGKLLKAPI